MSATFGPTALVTPANALTLTRVALTPVMLVLVLGAGPSIPVLLLWIALAGTDGFDGVLARRHGTTRSGAFLDPLADKLLVLGAMLCLVSEGLLWWLPVTLIAAREVAMGLYRSRVARHGVSVPARPLAKAKTVVQAIVVGFALLPVEDAWYRRLTGALLLVALALTLVSGAQYMIEARRRHVAL
jgi:CDP-diacylglycerol--glycerol-3-phosphate 3-phosphatidyltransferase